MYLRATDVIIAKLKDSDVTYMVETLNETSVEAPGPVILHGAKLDFHADLFDVNQFGDSSQGSGAKSFPCSYFCSKNKAVFSVEVCKIYIRLLRCYFAYCSECLKFGIIDLY